MPSIQSTEIPRAALRVSEACSALAISRSKLYLELAAGRLRAVKCGRREAWTILNEHDSVLSMKVASFLSRTAIEPVGRNPMRSLGAETLQAPSLIDHLATNDPVPKGCRQRALSPRGEVADELLVQGQAFHATGKQNAASVMVSTPGDVPFVVQEVTDLVRHDANERFAIVEHRGIALVDNHAIPADQADTPQPPRSPLHHSRRREST